MCVCVSEHVFGCVFVCICLNIWICVFYLTSPSLKIILQLWRQMAESARSTDGAIRTGKQNYSGNKKERSQCQVVHHKSYVDQPGIAHSPTFKIKAACSPAQTVTICRSAGQNHSSWPHSQNVTKRVEFIPHQSWWLHWAGAGLIQLIHSLHAMLQFVM